MSPIAARVRLWRVGWGLAFAVGGGFGLVGLATLADGGSPAQGLTAAEQLLPGLLALGGAAAGAQARARGEDRALAAMGATPRGWSLAGLGLGALIWLVLQVLLGFAARASGAWVRGDGGWFHEGAALADRAGGIVWPSTAGLAPGVLIGGLACASGLACGRSRASGTVRLAGSLGIAALAILAQHAMLLSL